MEELEMVQERFPALTRCLSKAALAFEPYERHGRVESAYVMINRRLCNIHICRRPTREARGISLWQWSVVARERVAFEILQAGTFNPRFLVVPQAALEVGEAVLVVVPAEFEYSKPHLAQSRRNWLRFREAWHLLK
jgi:hypothetical protein